MASAEQKIAEIMRESSVRGEQDEHSTMLVDRSSHRAKKTTSFRQTATLDTLSSSELNLYENDRPALTEKDLIEKYNYENFKSENALHSSLRYVSKRYKPSGNCLINFFLDRIPIIKWLRVYNIKESALKDVIAGVTIGIMHIPQGMAYALVAGLPAVYGLYVSLFPVFIYSLLGTSRQLSMGTFAITSIMTYSAIVKLEGKYYTSNNGIDMSSDTNFTASASNLPLNTANFLSDDPTEAKIKIR
jgi:hypothetical protein